MMGAASEGFDQTVQMHRLIRSIPIAYVFYINFIQSPDESICAHRRVGTNAAFRGGNSQRPWQPIFVLSVIILGDLVIRTELSNSLSIISQVIMVPLSTDVHHLLLFCQWLGSSQLTSKLWCHSRPSVMCIFNVTRVICAYPPTNFKQSWSPGHQSTSDYGITNLIFATTQKTHVHFVHLNGHRNFLQDILANINLEVLSNYWWAYLIQVFIVFSQKFTVQIKIAANTETTVIYWTTLAGPFQ